MQALYKYPISQYPVLNEINSAIDPFFKLFSVVVKWQRAEKKWTDGAFLDLDSEVIEGEVDEYWRELYKIQKFFNNKFKKAQVTVECEAAVVYVVIMPSTELTTERLSTSSYHIYC